MAHCLNYYNCKYNLFFIAKRWEKIKRDKSKDTKCHDRKTRKSIWYRRDSGQKFGPRIVEKGLGNNENNELLINYN